MLWFLLHKRSDILGNKLLLVKLSRNRKAVWAAARVVIHD